MKTILAIAGLIFGIFFFCFIIKRIHFVYTNFFTIGMIFVVCVSLGVLAAYLLGWIVLILAAVFFIYWIYTKVSSKDSTENKPTQNTVDSPDDKTEKP